jgi:4-hydroxy-2-oxoheptanedioate aldolase
MANLNPLKAAWAEGRTAFGLWSAIPSSFSAELAAGAGFDYVCVDQQHGVIDYDSIVPMFQAIGAAETLAGWQDQARTAARTMDLFNP